MKKILITTFHRANNYGAILQTIGLSYFLKDKYDVNILDYDNKYISSYYKCFRKLGKNPIRNIKTLTEDAIYFSKTKKRRRNFDLFRNNLSLTKLYSSIQEIKTNNFGADVIITGSDQVWNPNITGGIDDIYFLNFEGKQTKRIAYAASCGNIKYLKDNQVEFINKINNINSISVREDDLCQYINSLGDYNAKTVLDPTFLLKKDDWKNLLENERIEEDKYIFVYSVDNATKLFYDSVNYLAKEKKLKIVYFDRGDLKNNFKCEKKSYYENDPLIFLNLLYYSECVITTSFHGLALSTIFNKEFHIVLSTYPDRLLTLTKKLNLSDRIVTSFEDFQKNLNREIKWDDVNKKLEIERNKSIEWLINSIEGNESDESK